MNKEADEIAIFKEIHRLIKTILLSSLSYIYLNLCLHYIFISFKINKSGAVVVDGGCNCLGIVRIWFLFPSRPLGGAFVWLVYFGTKSSLAFH